MTLMPLKVDESQKRLDRNNGAGRADAQTGVPLIEGSQQTRG